MKPLKFFNKQLNKLFPTHILLDQHLTIISCGPSIENALGRLTSGSFLSKFSISNHNQEINFEIFKQFQDINISLTYCESFDCKTFNGKVTYFEDSEQLLLIIDDIFNAVNRLQSQSSKVNLDINKLDVALEEIGHTFWFHDLDDALELPNVLHVNDRHEGFLIFLVMIVKECW